MLAFVKKHNDSLFFTFIIIVSIILRFWNISEIPFMHDEFSAIFRTNFSSFSELINLGVKIEGHPPAIQVFLFYWIKFVGISEPWIKFPFIVMGVFAVYFTWKISKEWYGVSSAIIVSLLIAVLQYPIFYSQIARPYVSGLFFVLAFTFYWNKLVFHSSKKNIQLILYVLFGTLSAYNHHFSLLQVAIIGLTGLFFIKKDTLIRYVLANTFLIILYLPNLSIFFTQLGYKGLEWISVPDFDFLINYLYYWFNFSFLVIITLLLLLFWGIIGVKKSNASIKIFISLAWFVIPTLIGYLYSLYIAPVLQFSVLIFAFPFLLFAIFGWVKNQSYSYKIVAFLLVLGVTIYSLVFERKHYQIFYNSPYEKIIEDAVINYKNYDKNDCLILFNYNAEDTTTTPYGIFQYYLKQKKMNGVLPFVSVDALTLNNYIDFQEQLYRFKGNYVFYGYLASSPPEIYAIIKNYFPYIKHVENYYGGNTVLFSKTPQEDTIVNSFISLNTFEKGFLNWENPSNDRLLIDSTENGNHSYQFNSKTEWGISFQDTLYKITNTNNFIDISLDVKPIKNLRNALLVSVIEANGETIDWRATSFNAFRLNSDVWNPIIHSIKLQDMNLNKKNAVLKVFIWNKENQEFLIDNFKISERKGNPFLYWIIEKEAKN
ncbi:MAG: hypothetical protein HYU68_09470 [Bacteroidetes bacterium]|nr:hypothetical protein [Bacteroidota bacterium]